MSFFDMPYVVRLGVLVLFAGVMIFLERRRDKESRVRQWEYGFLFILGAVGAVYGVINDSITVSISPDYFTFGKGLQGGEGLTSRAIMLGAQAGFSAGVIACMIWQVILRRVPPPKRCVMMFKMSWMPFVCAGALAFLMPLIFRHTDPLGFKGVLPQMSAERAAAFMTVWWVHIGAYLGLLIGLIAAVSISVKRDS